MYNNDGSINALPLVFGIAILVLSIAVQWRIFEKAGKAGWISIVPFYNLWVLAEISGLSGWIGLLTMIPYVGVLVGLYVLYMLPQRFGKSALFGVGVAILGFIFLPILAFDDSKHDGMFGV